MKTRVLLRLYYNDKCTAKKIAFGAATVVLEKSFEGYNPASYVMIKHSKGLFDAELDVQSVVWFPEESLYEIRTFLVNYTLEKEMLEEAKMLCSIGWKQCKERTK